MRVDPQSIPIELRRLRGALDAPLYMVGGVVRDMLRQALDQGRQESLLPYHSNAPDVDLTTPMRPKAVLERLGHMGYRVLPTGLEHGTVTVVRQPGGRLMPAQVEITTYRFDRECDGRHARVEFADTLQEDLIRRDFTVNALALDLEDGVVVDHVGGLVDLAERRVRAVGDPATRFVEDRLRLIRAVRFATLLQGDIEPGTWRALSAAAPTIMEVSAERIHDELTKMLGYAHPSRGLAMLWHSGLLRAIVPQLANTGGCAHNHWHSEDVFHHTLRVVDALPASDSVLRLAGLLHDVAKPASRDVHPDTGDYTFYRHETLGEDAARRILQRLRFSNRDTERVATLVRHHMFSLGDPPLEKTVRRWMSRVGEKYVDDLLALRRADILAKAVLQHDDPNDEPELEGLAELRRLVACVRASAAALKISDLAVGGRELIELGLQPGPVFTRVLRQLLDVVIEEPSANERERLLALVREWQERGELDGDA